LRPLLKKAAAASPDGQAPPSSLGFHARLWSRGSEVCKLISTYFDLTTARARRDVARSGSRLVSITSNFNEEKAKCASRPNERNGQTNALTLCSSQVDGRRTQEQSAKQPHDRAGHQIRRVNLKRKNQTAPRFKYSLASAGSSLAVFSFRATAVLRGGAIARPNPSSKSISSVPAVVRKVRKELR
jgi:hypothetical protein